MGLTALLATTWFQISTAAIVNSAKHVAQRYATASLERAQNDLLESISAQIAASGPGVRFTAPALVPPAPACASSPCAFFVATSVRLSGQTGQPGGASSGGESTASNVQQHEGVGEERVAAIVSVIVTNAPGAVLARASRRLTLRTFGVAPYVALTGVDEPVAGNANVADFAGSCDGSASCGNNDNRIHALLRCSDPVTPSNCDGQPYRRDDTFNSSLWHNANASADAWSR
jgi:hypothetical protein